MNHNPLFGMIYKSRKIAPATLCVIASLFFAQAGRADDVPKVPNIKADAALAALVPQFYRERGTLTVGVNPDVKPIKFVDDEGKIAGFTPDLLAAAADVLNLKLELIQTTFDAMIPAMSANRLDVLLSLGDLPSRHKVVTFVDYLDVGQTIVGSPEKHLSLKSLDDMCGLQVAMGRGSSFMQRAATINVSCVKDGKKPLTVATYPDENMTLLSLSTGASDVAWVDSPTGYYNANKFPAKYEVIYFYPLAPYGIGFGVDEKGKRLAVAVRQALLKLQKDGTYDMLIKKWGLSPKDGKPLFPINDAQL